MKFFKIDSKSNMNDILDKFDTLSEFESHNIFTSLFETYYSSRIGIHSYLNGNKVRGYYETGKKYARGNRLISQKNWFFLAVKQTQEGSSVKGFIIGDVFSMGIIYSVLLSMFYKFLTNSYFLFEFLLVSLLSGLVLYNNAYKPQINLYDEIKSIINAE